MLVLELIVIFVLVPLGYRFAPISLSPLPVLWLAAYYCYRRLKNMQEYSFARDWNPAGLRQQLSSILIPFLCFVVLSAVTLWLYAPADLFSLVKHKPWLWGIIMVLYPLLSVYPQSLIYRAFFMTRYRELFPSSLALVLVSGAAFSWMHLIFRNPIAMILTFVGGVLFAWRYRRTGSLAASSFEHALYGCALFTLGLGGYFYHGRIPLQ